MGAPLNAVADPTKQEEIRRTVYVANLATSISPEQLLTFFTQSGEVKYVRMAGDQSLPLKSAFIEFTEMSSVPNALALNGTHLADKPIR